MLMSQDGEKNKMIINKVTISQEKAQELISKGICQASDFKRLKLKAQKLDTIKIRECNLEIIQPIPWTKSYSEIKAPKGFRLPELWELIKIMQTTNFFQNYEKGDYRYFLANQTKEDKEKNIVHGLGRDGSGYWDADWSGDLDNFLEDCRVVFVRDLKEIKK